MEQTKAEIYERPDAQIIRLENEDVLKVSVVSDSMGQFMEVSWDSIQADN